MLRRHPTSSTLAASASLVRRASTTTSSSSGSRSSLVGRRPRASGLREENQAAVLRGASLHALRASWHDPTRHARLLSTTRRIGDQDDHAHNKAMSTAPLRLPEHPLLLGWGTDRRPLPGLASSLRPFSSQPAAPKTDAAPQKDGTMAPASAAAANATTTAPPAAAASTTAGSAPTPPPRYVEEGFKPEDLKPEQGVEDPRKEENSPSTVGGVVRRYSMKGFSALRTLPGMVLSFTVMAGRWVVTFVVETIKNPSTLTDRWLHIKKIMVEEFHHYKLGSKVLWSDIKTSWSIVRRLLHGHTLSRRERRQLTRTTADLFRLVPFAFFVIVPFMELLLPFALKIFPNMLPSTFQDSLKTEENMKRELKVRLALAGFLKDTLGEIATKRKDGKGEEAKESPNAALLTEFVEKARAGTHISTVDINRFARLFKDELTLDNMSRPQLAGMCVYMGLRPYGSDNFLRFQLRAKLRNLKEDDQRIVWEGVDNMTKGELREACRERGMRAYGLTQLGYRRQLQQWLDLSINKEVPISLLILSRAFTLDSKFTDPAAAVADSISSLDKDVVNEVLLDVATGSELRNPDLRARKLESIERQNELIEEERKRDAVRRKKAEDEKKKVEEEKKAKEKAAADAAAAAAKPAGDATTDAALAHADTQQVKEAVAHAAAITGTTPKDGAPHPTPKPEEAFPTEKVLTEAEVVSKALPSLDLGKPVPAPTQAEAAATAAAVAAQEVKDEQAEEAAKVEEGKKKKPELTVAEIKALRTLVKESSVDQEKTTLAKLKAELQAAEEAKKAKIAAAAAAAAAAEAAAPPPTIPVPAAATTESAATPTLDLTLPPPSSSSSSAAPVPDAAMALAAAGSAPAPPTTAVTGDAGAPVAAAGGGAAAAPTPAPAPAPPTPAVKAEEKSSSAMDKALDRMRMKVASMLDKLEVDIEKVETTIGDKLHMLDKDKDGVLTTAELSEVISHVLKRHTSEEEAKKIALSMDKDADGILTVQELMEWIEHREELLEELGDDDNNNTPVPTKKETKAPAPPSAGAGAPAAATSTAPPPTPSGDKGRESK